MRGLLNRTEKADDPIGACRGYLARFYSIFLIFCEVCIYSCFVHTLPMFCLIECSFWVKIALLKM